MTEVDQHSFISAVMDANTAAPNGLKNHTNGPAGKRFDVYRNNVAVSLTEALIAAFPVVHKLVGDAFFKATAGVYLRAYPPSSPLMMFYGEEFPAFLSAFEPVQKIPYLPDIARLELAMRRSYHAADATAIDPNVLQTLAPDALLSARMHLAPAVQVIQSDWPIHAIYIANTQNDAPKPIIQPEAVLITRPEFDPVIHLLSQSDAVFVQALISEHTFGEAVDMANQIKDFELSTSLGLLLAAQAIVSID